MRGGSNGLMLGYIQEFWYSTLENHEKNIEVVGLRAGV
jgi:hypothetical protein